MDSDKQLVKDHIHKTLHEEIYRIRSTFNTFTMSTIRWLQRYSHCYSIVCSFICLPLWILILPIAFVLDICIFLILSFLFIIIFILSIIIAPFQIACKYSSAKDGCNPVNIYRYGLANTIMLIHTIYVFYEIMWTCYCGSGEIQDGAPICCIYICPKSCHRACHQATHVEITDQPCTIL